MKTISDRIGPDNADKLLLSALNPALEGNLLPFTEKTELLLPPSQLLTWREIVDEVSEPVKESVNYLNCYELYDIRDKKTFELTALKLLKPRSKSDLSIRRSRLRDFFQFHKRVAPSELKAFLTTGIRDSWDYIFVMNILAVTAVMSWDWFHKFSETSAFDGNLSHFVRISKKVSDLIKTKGLRDSDWSSYVEASVLSGYRNLPFPGFEPELETEKLANGGDPHNYFGFKFKDLVDEFLPMYATKDVKYRSFKDFVVSGEWSTSGASSIGRVEVEHLGNTESFKARKNFVPDVSNLDDIYQICLTWNKQENYSIIKSELGKVRMAVASDLPMYLQMTWINTLLGGSYNSWPGSTTDEDFTAQTLRLNRMLRLAALSVGLPYDYAAFDHQPTLEELVAISDHILAFARTQVPFAGLPDFDHVSRNISESFYHSTLEWKQTGSVFPVTGGLMSGLRWTSLVGNAWNTVMTGLVLKLCTTLGVSVEDVNRFIRGDDSAIFTPGWAKASLINECYNAVGVKAGVGKFSIREHAMEFLRVWYQDRCIGYPMRAIPGLTQRKPWSNSPWSPTNVIKSIYDTIHILRRRVPERQKSIDALWKHLKTIWLRDHRLPCESLQTPIHYGGFGVEPCLKPGRIVPPLPASVDSTPFTVKINPWRQSKLSSYYKERYDIDIPQIDAERMAQEHVQQALVSDDIPSIGRLMRDSWKLQIKRSYIFEPIEVALIDDAPAVDINIYPLDQPELLAHALDVASPQFDSQPQLVTVVNDYKALRPEMSLRSWIRNYDPKSSDALARFHPDWHLSDRIDYLTGNISARSYMLHPSLTWIWHRLIAASVHPRLSKPRLRTIHQARPLESYLLNTLLATKLYSW